MRFVHDGRENSILASFVSHVMIPFMYTMNAV
jgi:hypothetical protein